MISSGRLCCENIYCYQNCRHKILTANFLSQTKVWQNFNSKLVAVHYLLIETFCLYVNHLPLPLVEEGGLAQH